jgi:hypothetical protein
VLEQRIKSKLKQELKQRRPLAPEWVYASAFSLLALLPAAVSVVSGTRGWSERSGPFASAALLVSALLAPLLGLALARSMTPGSATLTPWRWVGAWVAAFALALAASARSDALGWTEHERHCFVSGSVVGLILALPALPLVRRGAILDWPAALSLGAFLCGMGGLLVLESGCYNPGLWHILTSHLPVPFALAAGATLLALVPRSRRRQ